MLADEINRTPPKTQAALLEAMQEFSVTYAGTTYQLERPFFVLATQNPIEQSGTYPLPEAQLDRFLFHVRMDYPREAEEVSILRHTTGAAAASATAVLGADELTWLQQLTREVRASEEMLAYIARLVRATRPDDGAGPLVREWVRWARGPAPARRSSSAARHGRCSRGDSRSRRTTCARSRRRSSVTGCW